MATDKLRKLPSTYYRVTIRAIIFDERQRLLVIEDADGRYELPGGGWEYNESFEECIRREVQEELGVDVDWVGNLWFSYRGKRPRRPWFLRLAVPVIIKDTKFKMGDGMKAAYFVTRSTFLTTSFTADEMPILKHVDDLWLPKEKES